MAASVVRCDYSPVVCLVVFLCVTCLTLFCIAADAESESAPAVGAKQHNLALLPENPHYFLFRGKPAVLITSAEHYGAVLNLDFDYVPYLQELKRNGLNLTRLFVGSYREIPGSFSITENTLAPSSGRYAAPWERSNTPGYYDGTNRFDLSKFSAAYFTRLRSFVREASNQGVVVEVNLFCPNYDDSLWHANPMYTGNNINGIGSCPANEAYTLKHADLLRVQQSLVKKIVGELSEYDNIYFEICNEPYFGGVTMEWQKQIGEVISKAEAGRPHLISMNIANGREMIVDPVPEVSIFNFHYATPPDTVEMNYAHNKVIGENETGFRGSDDWLYRTEAWEFLLAGGGLYNNLDYSFSASHPDGSLEGYRSPGGGSRALRDELGALKAFLYSFEFWKMRPDNNIIKGGVPDKARAHALCQDGKQYAVYILGGTHADITLAIPAGNYHVEWIDTVSGKILESKRVRHTGGDFAVNSPPYMVDIAVRIKSTK